MKYGVFLAMLLLAAAPAHAKGLDANARVRNLIWAQELDNYAGRATVAGMARYIASISEDYLVWPPGAKAPINAAELRRRAATNPVGDKERLTIELTGFTLHDRTAIIYYSSHKTMTATGQTVDERYDTVHVWVRDGKAWKLTGGLARRNQ